MRERQISFSVSEDTFRYLELGKIRYDTWKQFILACIISKYRRYLSLPGMQEHWKRGIQQIQRELGGPTQEDPKNICPHCLKEF